MWGQVRVGRRTNLCGLRCGVQVPEVMRVPLTPAGASALACTAGRWPSCPWLSWPSQTWVPVCTALQPCPPPALTPRPFWLQATLSSRSGAHLLIVGRCVSHPSPTELDQALGHGPRATVPEGKDISPRSLQGGLSPGGRLQIQSWGGLSHLWKTSYTWFILGGSGKGRKVLRSILKTSCEEGVGREKR